MLCLVNSALNSAPLPGSAAVVNASGIYVQEPLATDPASKFCTFRKMLYNTLDAALGFA
jgi:hypothetical protein